MAAKPTYEELEKRLLILDKELASHKSLIGTGQLNQRYLEAILSNTNMPVFLKDNKYNYIFMNRQFEHLAGVTLDQAVGRDDFAVFSKTVAQLFRSQDEEVVQRRRLVEFEETILLPGGLHTFLTAKFPLFNSDGALDGVGGICTDITARKQAEAELEEAEGKYRGIFEHSPLGILQINKEGKITASNEKLAEILGSSVDKIVGLDLLQSLKDENVKTAVISVLSGKAVHYEGPYLPVTGGECVYLRCFFSPITSNDGSVVAAIVIIENITRQKETEKALLRAHEELERRVADRTLQLDRKTERLKETNVALKILLEQREEDKKEFEEKILFNVEKRVYPYLEKLKLKQSDASRKVLLNIIRSNLEEITSSFSESHKNYLLNLTPTQIQIADLIKHGHTTKEIASLLSLSPATIACHRQEIRKRLLLTNKKTNLQAALTANS
jgi:PAS domain S-box-containing protein